MRFTLPWPPSALNPNARVHWSVKGRSVRRYRVDARLMATMASGTFCKPSVGLVFHPPDKRRRDLDNCLASFKAGLDGIADALGVNDSHFRISMQMGPPVKLGEVEVTIGE